jgi:hypothetical protein
MTVLGLDHVQLAMPAEREQEARPFYGQLLGLVELAKPSELACRARLASVLNRARSVHLGAPMRAHLGEIALRLGLTCGPNLYPAVIDLARATRTKLRTRFPAWAPAWP